MYLKKQQRTLLRVFDMSAFHVLCITVTYAVLFVSKSSQAELDEKQHSPVVQTESGAVVGRIETLPHGKSVHEYLGIPYAEPPVGDLRFTAPKPVKPWSGIKHATAFGASCPQNPLPIPGLSNIQSGKNSEDCLFLNVFVPSTNKFDDKMAVMVWIHGGSFAFGSSSDHPAGVLAAFNDVIIVSINYRLGVLGFFNVQGTDLKGNYGMLDQVLALKWVQANIAGFGGDPNKVTIFGASAGAISVSLHLISPLSKGLFHRAIIQSSASSSPLYNGKVTKPKQLELFSKATNCSLGPDLVECVRAKTMEDILLGQNGITLLDSYVGPQDIVGPIVDGQFLPDLPETLYKSGQFHSGVDVLAGFTSSEGAMAAMVIPYDQVKDGIEQEIFEFAVRNGMIYAREKSKIIEDLILFQYTNQADPDNKVAVRQLMIDSFSDSSVVSHIMLEAKALGKGGRPPYVYLFDHRPVYSPLPNWLGVIHGMDVPFVFGVPFKNIPDRFSNMLTPKYSEIEKGLSLYVMKLWTDFAKYGSPNPPDSGPSPVTWPTFTEQEQAYLVLDVKPRVERRFRAEKVAFWNEIVPKILALTQAQKAKTEEKTQKDEL